MHRILLLITLLVGFATAQVNLNIEQQPWTTCTYLNGCNPGGINAPTKAIATHEKWDSDPAALLVKVTGPPYSNALWWDKLGPTDANHFQAEFDVYIPKSNVNSVEAYEYDIFAFNEPYEFMFGTECVSGAAWQIWNGLAGKWVDTPLACKLTPGNHHIELFAHRTPGDSCQGVPCMSYDLLSVDYEQLPIGMIEPANTLPAGWNGNSGLNIQLDLNARGGTASQIVSHIQVVEF